MNFNGSYKKPIVILFFVSLLISLRSLNRIIATVAPDFNVFYFGTQAFLQGDNPYLSPKIFTGIGYPANTLLFYIPLLLLPYFQAQALFTTISFASIVAAVYLSIKIATNHVHWKTFLLTLSLALLSFPVKFTLGMGQNNAIAFLLLLASFRAYQRKRIFISGTLLGLAISLKTIFIFFAIFFLAKKQFKTLLTALITVTAAVLLVFQINSLPLYPYWFTQVIPPLLNLSGREIYYNQGLLGFISRIVSPLGLRRVVYSLVSLLLVIKASRLSFKGKKPILEFSLFITTLLLVDSLSWQHHFIWLIFPFVAVTHQAIKLIKTSVPILILLAILLVSFNLKHPERLALFPQSLLLSHVFYGTLMVYYINRSQLT